MFKIDMRINGRKITSNSQLQREFTKAIEGQVEAGLKRMVGPGVRLKKRPGGGFVAEGSAAEVERLRRRLR